MPLGMTESVTQGFNPGNSGIYTTSHHHQAYSNQHQDEGIKPPASLWN